MVRLDAVQTRTHFGVEAPVRREGPYKFAVGLEHSAPPGRERRAGKEDHSLLVDPV